ncbi:MAG TPA: MarR family transcriptional regulator [Candidatus Nanopelagicales bacterium]|jgi:DNA-binding MarR family transcriptional regulator|nr:MarR family transcriptional regulator [Candidatus Nanopelagicales bacterium]
MSERAGSVPSRRQLPFDPIDTARTTWTERGWEQAAVGMAAVTSVMRAHQIMLARVDEVLRPLGLTFARYEVLMLLQFSRTGAMPLGKVGSRLQVHPASVTNAVDRLQAEDLVRRLPHPTDGRTTLAEITPGGRALAQKATDALNGQVFSRPGLSRRKLEQLVLLLADLRHDAGDF